MFFWPDQVQTFKSRCSVKNETAAGVPRFAALVDRGEGIAPSVFHHGTCYNIKQIRYPNEADKLLGILQDRQ